MNKICYVSVYLDIGRSKWNKYPRTFEDYLERFLPYFTLFSSESEKDQHMILFIDDRYTKFLESHINSNTRIHLIPINLEWMKTNLPMWQTLEIEKNIMNSESYKKLISHRSECPETYCAEYTLINHCKIDFMNYVIDNICTDSIMYAWTDFGFFSRDYLIPKRLLDINKFDLSKINYTLLNDFTEYDRDVYYTLMHAPERIGGFFFCGSKNSMKKYGELYHYALNYYQSNNIADDDQALAQFCYFRNPDMFNFVYKSPIWHQVYTLCQL
uniref:Uncharacterized protein n=1 Tax=viral metagenome TaxID=1070528 RepID=A0A6C0D0L8_9ZZZZ